MRRQFALTVLAVTTMVALAFALPFAAVIHRVANDQALIAADQESQSLAGVLSALSTSGQLETVLSQLNATGDRRAAVVLPDNRQLGAHLEIPRADLVLARSGRAFTTTSGNETLVVVPVRLSSGQVSVGIVGVATAALDHGVAFAWLMLAVVSVAIVALGVAFADRLARSIVNSARALSAVTRSLQRGELIARVTPSGPTEIREVGVDVNVLAGRITEMLDHERETAADLSHRLRTPLMALQLEAENVIETRQRVRLERAVQDLAEALSETIRRARREQSSETVTGDLNAVVVERLAFWSALAEDQGRHWTIELHDGPLPVPLEDDDLGAVIDALLTNVFSHTPEGVDFALRTAASESGAFLVVEDAGQGFSADDPPRRGKSASGSTGLGLDIVEQSARRTGGTMLVGRSATGGASVTVRFGATRLVEAG
jgi:signal transduction histidine kinase